MIKIVLILTFMLSTLYIRGADENISIENSIKQLEEELLYRGKISKEPELFNLNLLTELYKKQKSHIVSTVFSDKPLKIVFNGEFDDMNLDLNQKKYITKNIKRNGFMKPNIIHLSYVQNKSFSYSFFQNNFYEEPLRSYTQHILLFHELAHFYASENIVFYKEFSAEDREIYKFKTYVEESYADLFAISFLTKKINVKKEDLNMFFDGLIEYRNISSHFLYAGQYSLTLLKLYYLNNYENIIKMENKDFAKTLYELNKKILFGNYTDSLDKILPNYLKTKDNIDLKEFFIVLKENNIKKIEYTHIKNIFL
jgi:hypothetical protein